MTTTVLIHDCENPLAKSELFRVRLAQTLEDLTECQRLRYLVFNCELGEGLDSSRSAELDRDRFDFICDHLMVHDAATGELVGTYRMQSGYRAKGNLGYYGEELFEFGPFEASRAKCWSLEELASIRSTGTGRFCICYGEGLRGMRAVAGRDT